MTATHSRRRAPDDVKTALFQATIEGASRCGLAELSIKEIAALAGFTKGGLYHHYASKEELIDAVFDQCLVDFGDAIQERIKQDKQAYGRFTRAYVQAAVDACVTRNTAQSLFIFNALTDKKYAYKWDAWVSAKLSKYPDEQHAPALRIARSAADGLWLQCFGMRQPEEKRAATADLCSRLVALTMPD
ncbi:MAG: TetR/AcrR family transcriptional regulator [Cellvibrio sp.]|uniref:TetR/AcrR family transcriptional regulator n=1 Tax=Cellvibrio sp. TaxID=1965322 RepID=UPI0031A2F267